MKSRLWLTFLLLLALCAQIFALGKKEEEAAIKTLNDDWTLCVTDFDTSSLGQDKFFITSVITNKFVEKLNIISYHTRVSVEYAYYEGYAWAKSRSAAAKALSAKQDERSLLIYNGDPGWKYRLEIAKKNTDIEKLKTAFEEIENNPPLINNEPVFKLTVGNQRASYPAPPKAGGENKFCMDQKADAFLTGQLMDFHGRFYVAIKLYAVYTKSFIYEDSIIFSADDLDMALDEIASRMIAVISGSKPASVTIRTQPQDALVLVNRTFAGKGESTTIEHPPGKITVTASAPDHESIVVETELSSGDEVEIDIHLQSVEYGSVEISGAEAGGAVYHGSLYIGEAPLTLRLPVDVLDYIELRTGDNKTGTAVFYTPENTDESYTLAVRTSAALKPGRVDKARRTYYWAWGGTWITGIAAWLIYHTTATMFEPIHEHQAVSDKYANDYTNMDQIRTGALIAVGAAVLHEIFQIGRYVYISDKGSTPVVKTGRNKE